MDAKQESSLDEGKADDQSQAKAQQQTKPGPASGATAAETDEFGPNFVAENNPLDDVLSDVLELDSDDLIELGSQAQQGAQQGAQQSSHKSSAPASQTGRQASKPAPPPLRVDKSSATKPPVTPEPRSAADADASLEVELGAKEEDAAEQTTSVHTAPYADAVRGEAKASAAEGLAELFAQAPNAKPFQPRLEDGPKSPDEISLSPEAEQDLEDLISSDPRPSEPPKSAATQAYDTQVATRVGSTAPPEKPRQREDTPQLRHADLYEDDAPVAQEPMSLERPQTAATAAAQEAETAPTAHDEAAEADAEFEFGEAIDADELIETSPLGVTLTDVAAPSAEDVSLLALADTPASASVDIVVIGDEGAGLGEFAELLADQCSAIRCDPNPQEAALAPEHPGIFRRSYAVQNKIFCDATQHLRSAQPLALFGIGLGSLALIVAGFIFSAPLTVAAGLFALALEVLVVRGHFMRRKFEQGRVEFGIWQVSGEALASDPKTSSTIAQLIEGRNDQPRPAHVALVYLEDPLLLAPIRCQEAHQRRRRLKQSILALSRHFRERAPDVDVRVLHCIERGDMIQGLTQMFNKQGGDTDLTVGVIPRPAQVDDDLEALAPESGGYYLDLQELSRLSAGDDDASSASQRRSAGHIDADLTLCFDTSSKTKLVELSQNDSLQADGQEPAELSHAMRAMLDRWELQCAIDPAPLRLVSYEYDRRARQQAAPALRRVIRSCGSGLLRSGWTAT